MTMFTTAAQGRPQVLVDEQQLAQMRAELQRRGAELERLKAAMETLSAVNTPARFMAAAMGLCNEMASRWKAERVGIGFLRGRYVRLMALSHTEKITRHMQLVQNIESAMEECLDQDVEVLVPPPKDAGYVYRAAQQLSDKQGPNTVCSLPLRRGGGSTEGGEPVAVLTIERKPDAPLTLEEIETLRLTCDLFTARLDDLYHTDRWIGAKMARSTRKGLAWAVGTKHTWAKAAAVATAAFLAFAIFCRGTYRVESTFTLEAVEKQVVPAPYDGFLKTVNATAGDVVMTPATAKALDAVVGGTTLVPLLPSHRPPTVLATLSTIELQDKLAESEGEYAAQMKEAEIDRSQSTGPDRDQSVGKMQMAMANAQKALADINLSKWKIAQGTIVAPVDGIVLSGDLKTKLGSPVKAGDELFTVGERDKLRAELDVPEDMVTDIRVGFRGQLASSSYPGEKIGFTVERIDPMATVNGNANVFKVRAKIDDGGIKAWMKPGMEGIAKVNVGTARYIWLWTHRPLNWVRMKLWL